MNWATRANIHIDRAACAWLIRRDLDPDARFIFVADPAEIPADATAFDLRGAELSHHNGDCSFETILPDLRRPLRVLPPRHAAWPRTRLSSTVSRATGRRSAAVNR